MDQCEIRYKSLLLLFPLGLLFGNVFGADEIYYITNHLMILAVASVWEFFQYVAGGALVYGLLCSLTLGIISTAVGLLVLSQERGEHQTVLVVFTSVLATVVVFPTLTQTIYHDILGLFEVPRFWQIGLVSLLTGVIIYFCLSLNFIRGLNKYIADILSTNIFSEPLHY